ncbi:DUF2071 domain-containing protein [Abditibacterium utsteinense]|uniref:DUF2071 domain-containing protein n=1 Tax=Abditibacterium utsteinense TaxID=1960156 RepID=UPI000CFDF684|nr:DUF2071 domain-containing protein [Abditibacterium utsteinense]
MGEAAPAKNGSSEQFLVERYVLYSTKNEAIYRGQVHHAPYQLQSAKLKLCAKTASKRTGFARPQSAPHVLYCCGVEVEIWALEPR